MSNKRRGIALVFCHMNFAVMAKRNGTDKDRDDICSTLSGLDFDVRVFNDLRRKELLRTLKNVSREDHSENDCLVVVVMSHGDQGVLYASDKKYYVDSLWEKFTGNACPSLIGKPKLFFVQASRERQPGKKGEGGREEESQASVDVVDSPNDSSALYFIPTMADFLVMYSTYDGYYSGKDPLQRSCLIQSLCMELDENGRERDLLALLTGVSRRALYTCESSVPHNEKDNALKPIPCVVSMLTKTFFFTKKT